MAKKILLIDDDVLIIKSLNRYLKSFGYDVETAQSGQEALEKTESNNFDLIISDIRMPGMDGIETLSKIRKSSADHNKEKIPTIIITGYAGGEDIYRKAGELGITECIYKPFELEEFIAAIKKNLDLPPKYKRTHSRVEIVFPVNIFLQEAGSGQATKITGKTLNLSENGIGLILDRLLPPSSSLHIRIDSTPKYPALELEATIIWGKPVFKAGYFQAGLHFLKIDEQHLATLRQILADYKLLDSDFVSFTKEYRQFLQDVKNKCDEFDRQSASEQEQVNFVEANRKSIFDKLDMFVDKTWQMVKDFEKDKYIIHQSYFQQMLLPFITEGVEINNHIYSRPLGYAGDFIMMNYIYEYNGSAKYLGTSSYGKLMNNYTCNIPISCANIVRKDFLKDAVSNALENNDEVKILSVACGPAREIVELLKEGRVNKPLSFKCLDLEKKALDYIDTEIKKIEPDKKSNFFIEYIYKDISSIIRDKNLKKDIQGCNLIYASGIFDYLSDRMSTRLVKELYALLVSGGKLIICNASLEGSSHRGFYEFIGDWNLIYRTKEQVLLWTKELGNNVEISLENPEGEKSYWFLIIKKQ